VETAVLETILEGLDLGYWEQKETEE